MTVWFYYGIFVGIVFLVGLGCALVANHLSAKEKTDQHRSTSHSAA